MNARSSQLDALNAVCNGWTEAGPGGMLTNPNPGGGIIDRVMLSSEWFVIFNEGSEAVEGIESREKAVEVFIERQRQRAAGPSNTHPLPTPKAQGGSPRSR